MERPLSPFMFPTWYRFQITSVLSILHRLTGIALALGSIVLAWITRDYSCMIRTKCPGGFLPAGFYLGIDKLTDLYGNGTIRVTTRGALQLHGVHKSDLHEVIHQINVHLGSTLAACACLPQRSRSAFRCGSMPRSRSRERRRFPQISLPRW